MDVMEEFYYLLTKDMALRYKGFAYWGGWDDHNYNVGDKIDGIMRPNKLLAKWLRKDLI